MVFSSLEFLCIFLPIVFILYTVIPSLKWKNGLLIAASLIFYAYGEPVYVFLLIFSALFNYFFARLIDRFDKKKLTLAAAVVVNLLILGVFKYTGFILDTVNGIFGVSIPVPEITLPIGISFFTFQALSYVIDVYRKDVEVQKSFFKVLLYISFFPQLIAGPIIKYHDVSVALSSRSQKPKEVAEGFRRFVCGLSKKVLIANTVGAVADNLFSADLSDINILGAWLGAIAYMMQIYYDFSGYSDMAIGLGKMFGFHFSENFNFPYLSNNIKEFWRRWHISLSTWFKEYLYIPLGGNRKGRARTELNKLIVFFCTGFWHGAGLTFIVWGLWHGLFLILEDFLPFLKKLPKALGKIYTLLVVCIGFVIFRADTLEQGLLFIKEMFTGLSFSAQSINLCLQQLTPWFIFILVVAVIGCAPIGAISNKIKAVVYSDALTKKGEVLQTALYIGSILLLLWCMIRLSGSTYNPFIYFRF